MILTFLIRRFFSVSTGKNTGKKSEPPPAETAGGSKIDETPAFLDETPAPRAALPYGLHLPAGKMALPAAKDTRRPANAAAGPTSVLRQEAHTKKRTGAQESFRPSDYGY